MKKSFVLTILFCIFSLSANAQEKYDLANNGLGPSIGAGGSVYSTWGFLYRQHFKSGFGLEGTLGGWITSASRGQVGGSLALLYTLAHHKIAFKAMPETSIRVYGGIYLGSVFRINDYYDVPNEKTMRTAHSYEPGIGPGFGAEYFFNRYFSVQLNFIWMTFLKYQDKKLTFRDSLPHVGGGLSYYF